MAGIRVCEEGDLADGAVRIVTAGNVELALIHENGVYYAYRNWCPHQGGPACEGVRMPRVEEVIDAAGLYLGKRYEESDLHIICPWHGYAYHLADGVNVCDAKLRLQKFEVVEREGGIYVSL